MLPGTPGQYTPSHFTAELLSVDKVCDILDTADSLLSLYNLSVHSREDKQRQVSSVRVFLYVIFSSG